MADLMPDIHGIFPMVNLDLVGATKVSSSETHRMNVFTLSSSGRDGGLKEVPDVVACKLARRRREHQKSKAGCYSCKKRRVKVKSHAFTYLTRS